MAEENGNGGNIAIIVILLLIIIWGGFYLFAGNNPGTADTGNSINVELPTPDAGWDTTN